jgi:uncharacterized protein YbbC (DUF1343 family)/uncharacterized lipoprotein YddW (UPF0748 family)
LFIRYLSDMKRKILLLLLSVFLIVVFTRCFTTRPAVTGDIYGRKPSAQREFRAAWVATVDNINWPSKPGLPVEDQKKEAIALLDLLAKNNFNAVIFQVRPHCDAMYNSGIEPWSYYLTGEEGKAPVPYYDPLEFWIKEAHARGLELHAWLNPYRAHHPAGGAITDASIIRKRPELVLKLEGDGYWWLDPALKGTQDHSFSVVMDLVIRYDLDGIHFDDYFYPYPDYNNFKDFPDEKSWNDYTKSGGKLLRGDWRREAVNTFIKRVYKGIKAEKPYVKFGLSPFGIWRPYNPPAIGASFDQHNTLYANAKKWLNEGWIDYYSPQLYWPVNQLAQSYPVLLEWWKSENIKNRHLWPGISLGGQLADKASDEAINEIMIARGILPSSPGVVHWSIGTLINSPAMTKAISDGPYRKKALVPSSPWLSAKLPESPAVNISLDRDTVNISWISNSTTKTAQWVIYYKLGSQWNYDIVDGARFSYRLPGFTINRTALNRPDVQSINDIEKVLFRIDSVAVTAIDRYGNESKVVQSDIPGLSFSLAPPLTEIIARYSQKTQESALKQPFVKPGIDVLLEDYPDLIKGKRVGLITNPSAVGSDMRSTIDILAGTPGVNLVALFGAEHGVRGALQGKIRQEGEPDPKTGIPVYSLYGDVYAPKRQWLDSLDVLLYDIQGVGSAWYTFKYSMSYAMQACAKAGKPFIVLDRPNPLGGRIVEGPMLDTFSIFRHSLPLRHGMTYGELATMWNETEGFGANLTVIKMKGWRRSMLWNETGLLWIMPSPNMGTFETAVVYPGQCLFERTNISEGRGTTKPFLLTGSTWIDPDKAANDLNSRGIKGAVFRPVYFVPANSEPGTNSRKKPWNKMAGGVEIMLTDPSAYRSVEAAINIFDAYRKLSPDSLKWSPPAIIKKLEEPGMTAEQVVKACQDDIADFLKIREKYLLYK